MTWPVARSVSPIFAALMKLSFRSKLIERATGGFSVRTERPMAESARVLIMPPCTKPEWLAMSSVAVISTTAVPSPVSTSRSPSHAHARDLPSPFKGRGGRGCVPLESLFTALSLRHRHAGGVGSRDEPAQIVDDVGLAEEQRLLHLDDAADSPQASFNDRAEKVDLQLHGGVPESVLLEGAQRHPHGGVRDL